MKKALILIFAALAIPSVALAAKTTPHSPKGAPKVLYILKGSLSNYGPYDSVTPANGMITIVVAHANKQGGRALHVLKGQTLTFAVDANTRISFADGVSAIANGDRGIVKIRAAKRIAPADLAATLQLSPARQIIGKGAPKPKP